MPNANETRQNKNRRSVKFLASFLLLSVVLSVFLLGDPGSVKALGAGEEGPVQQGAGAGVPAGAPVSITLDIPAAIGKAIDSGVKEIESAFKLAIAKSAMMFSRKVASQLAVKIARQTKPGTQGGGLNLQDIGTIMEDAGYAAAGEAIGTFSEKFFGDAGFLCNPNPYVKLVLALSMFSAQEPTPKCDGRQVVENYKNLYEQATDPKQRDAFMKRFAFSFQPNQSDLGSFTEALAKIEEKKQSAIQVKALGELWKGTPFEDVSSTISGYRQTSGQQIKKFVETSLIDVPAGESALGLITSMLTGATVTPFIYQFADSFVGEMMNLWVGGLFKTDIPPIDNPNAPGGQYGSNTQGQTADSANEQRFAALANPKIAFGGQVDIVAEFSVCPGSMKTINNCVIDSQFSDAIMNRMTVQEAIDQGKLHGEWAFGYTQAMGTAEPAYDNGYAASNMKKLRAARIIPDGWELAADKIAKLQDFPGAVTLQDVVNAFRQTGSIYYGLVDPDWVLKAPEQKCQAKIYSPLLAASGQRQEWCADTRSCIAESEDGSCKAWGYCTREKNVWRFSGDVCSPEYDTCQTFTRKSDDQQFSYLKNSLTYLGCDASNPHCYYYARNKDSQGKWILTPAANSGVSAQDENTWAPLSQNMAYYNRNIQACNQGAAGCNEFIRSFGGSGTNLIANGSWEKYYANTANSHFYFYGWQVNDINKITLKGDDAYVGANSLNFLQPGAVLTQTIPVGYELAERTFTLSFAAKNCGDQNRIIFGPVDKRLTDISSANPWPTGVWTQYSVTYTFPAGTSDKSIDLQLISAGSDGGQCLLDAVQVEEGERPTTYGEYGSSNLAYLKKPPVYLNCNGTASQSPECSNYAPVCSSNDVGCQQYTALSDGTVVSGLVKPGDICPSGCNGYRTYKQEASAFHAELFPLYFIAQTARTCDWQNSGCEEFTNLDTVAAGGEGRENYSFLRRCQLPSPTSSDCQSFYTWEGSDRTGYQLKLYNLKADPADPNEPLVVRNFTYLDAGGHSITTKDCKAIYGKNPGEAGWDPANTPDCREFYAPNGNITYRLYRDTVLCTADCHPYRLTSGAGLNETTGVTDSACLNSGGLVSQCSGVAASACQGGTDSLIYYNNICYNLPSAGACSAKGGTDWKSFNNQCVYLGTPQESQVCAAPGCQAYRGNFSGNRVMIFDDGFEGSVANWQNAGSTPVPYDGQLAAESYSVAGHSFTPINSNMTLSRKITEASIYKNQAYIISFWAKSESSAANRLSIKFGSATDANDVPVNYFAYVGGNSNGQPLDTNWRYYRLGPVYVNWDPAAPETVIFDSAENRKYYIDNVRLEQVMDTAYLISNSWTTPESCDQNQAGAPAPQFMLGCEAYQDANNQVKYLKSFFRLCNQSAIGCEALIDTRNSPNPWREAYNMTCSLADNAKCAPTGSAANCPCSINYSNGDEIKVCDIAQGATFCNYTWDQTSNLSLDSQAHARLAVNLLFTGVVYVPKDNFVYLVNKQDYSCAAEDKGCTAVAKPQLDAAGSVVSYLKNPQELDDNGQPKEDIYYFRDNPARYSTDLCNVAGFACEEFDAGGNQGSVYFKDPGQKVCEWRQRPAQAGSYATVSSYGWFERGSDTECKPDTTGKFDSDPLMGGWNNVWAKACPANQSGCTKFVDPSVPLTASNSTYYYLDNQALDTTSCNGLASQKKGCVLFNNYNTIDWAAAQKNNWQPNQPSWDSLNWQPEKTSNANATYQKSENSASAAVGPVDCVNPSGGDSGYCGGVNHGVNNANQIISVRRDRDCAEWLNCPNSYQPYDPTSNEYKTVCLGLGVCSSFKPGTTECGTPEPLPDPVQTIAADGVLSTDKYLQRSLDWDGNEFSGYSIPYLFPTWSLQEFGYGHCSPNNTAKLCLKSSDCGTGNKCEFANTAYRLSRVVQNGDTSTDLCLGKNDLTGVNGIPVNGSSNCPTGGIARAAKSCRGYPEVNSPFPQSAFYNSKVFADAKICSDTYGCDCHYEKGTFGDGGLNVYQTYSEPIEVQPGQFQTPSSSTYFCTKVDDAHPGMLGQPCDDDSKCMDPKSEPGYLDDGYQGLNLDDASTGYGKTPSAHDVCKRPTQNTTFFGWRGYCLEYDKSQHVNGDPNQLACLTWMPIDMVAGEPDIYSSDANAGFNFAAFDGSSYCVKSAGNSPASFTPLLVDSGCQLYGLESIFGPPIPVLWGRWEDSNHCYDFITDGGVGASQTGGRGRVLQPIEGQPDSIWQMRDDGSSNPFITIPSGIKEDDIKYIEIHAVGQPGDPSDWLTGYFRLSKSDITGWEWMWTWCGGDSVSITKPDSALTNDCDTYHALDGTWSLLSPVFATASACSTAMAATELNGFIVRAVFDSPYNGNFAGFDVGICDGSDAGGKISFNSIKLIMKETCLDLTQVATAEKPENFGNSYFKTNNVWANGSFSLDSKLIFGAQTAPFGKVSTDPMLFGEVNQWKYSQLEVGGKNLGKPIFGTSFLCAGGRCNSQGHCVNVNPFLPEGETAFGDLTRTCDPANDTCPSGQYCADSTAAVWTSGNPISRLQQLFAENFDYYSWAGSEYQKKNESSFHWDVRSSDGQAPKVWGAVIDVMTGSYVAYSPAQPGTVALNAKVLTGNIVSYGSNYPAMMSFYASNDNGQQMPLRQFLIDWKDNLPVTTFPSGLGDWTTAYPNFKPVCGGENFGDDANAGCRQAYFRANHLYACTTDSANYKTPGNCKTSDGQPVKDNNGNPIVDGCCIFEKPTVTVVDNWGICGAGKIVRDPTDDHQFGSSNGCYYKDSDNIIRVRYSAVTGKYPGNIVLVLPAE